MHLPCIRHISGKYPFLRPVVVMSPLRWSRNRVSQNREVIIRKEFDLSRRSLARCDLRGRIDMVFRCCELAVVKLTVVDARVLPRGQSSARRTTGTARTAATASYREQSALTTWRTGHDMDRDFGCPANMPTSASLTPELPNRNSTSLHCANRYETLLRFAFAFGAF